MSMYITILALLALASVIVSATQGTHNRKIRELLLEATHLIRTVADERDHALHKAHVLQEQVTHLTRLAFFTERGDDAELAGHTQQALDLVIKEA